MINLRDFFFRPKKRDKIFRNREIHFFALFLSKTFLIYDTVLFGCDFTFTLLNHIWIKSNLILLLHHLILLPIFLKCCFNVVSIPGLRLVHTSLRLSRDPTYSWALHCGTDHPHPRRAPLQHRPPASGSVRELRHTARPGTWQAGKHWNNQWFEWRHVAWTRLIFTESFNPGMHTIWPARAFNLAREAQNLVYLACFCQKTSFNMQKTYQFCPSNIEKKIFCPPRELSCVPLL